MYVLKPSSTEDKTDLWLLGSSPHLWERDYVVVSEYTKRPIVSIENILRLVLVF